MIVLFILIALGLSVAAGEGLMRAADFHRAGMARVRARRRRHLRVVPTRATTPDLPVLEFTRTRTPRNRPHPGDPAA